MLLPLLFLADTEITFGSQIRALHAPSAEAVTGDSYVGGRLTVGRQLYLPAPDGVDLYATAGFDWGGASGSMFNQSTDISTYALTVGGHARYHLYSHISLIAGVDLGMQHASLTFGDTAPDQTTDGAWGLMTRGIVAVELLAADSKAWNFGLRVEAGYTLDQKIALSPAAPKDDTELTIMTTTASIGHLDMSGPSIGFSAITRF